MEGVACVVGFGLVVTDLGAVLSETVASSRGTLRWINQGLLDLPHFGPNGYSIHESDYSVPGRVTHPLPYSSVPAILRGGSPERPPAVVETPADEHGELLVHLFWRESRSTQPAARQPLDHASPVTLALVPFYTPPPVQVPLVIDKTT